MPRQPDTDAERRAISKSLRYLVPLLVIGFTIMNLDRTNIGIAALTMNRELGISPQQFGLISGIFFAGYLLFEVPSNLILHRVGARLWISRIMLTWGALTTLTAFVNSPTAMLWCRVLLGVFEAGFLPGMLLYLTFWFAKEYRSRMLGWFFLGVPLATVIGSLLGGFLVGIDRMLGLTGWRWLFLIEGLATLVLAVVYFVWLPAGPAQARWLTEPEKAALIARLDAERIAVAERSHGITALTVFRQPRVLGLCGVLFGQVLALYGVGLWLPQLIRKSLGIAGVMPVALLTALPYLLATVVMVWWGKRADRRGSRGLHTAIPMVLGGLALASSALLVDVPWIGYAGLSLSILGVLSAAPAFFSLPSTFLTGVAAATGLAFINSAGNSAGFVGPYLVGWVTGALGSAKWGLVIIGLVLAAGGLLAAAMRLSEPPASARVAVPGPAAAATAADG
ncbi:MAG: transporter, family, tartrate transporter [Pseudonocardiales bacterium]|nr:transporter, family, tartrate transporter [Pseudonocardiales bacterium]